MIGIKPDGPTYTRVHNVVHNDVYSFVLYKTLEDAKKAAEHIKSLRQIHLMKVLKVG